MGRAFQAEGTAHAKSRRQKSACGEGKVARRLRIWWVWPGIAQMRL